jgi:hypothetical protein
VLPGAVALRRPDYRTRLRPPVPVPRLADTAPSPSPGLADTAPSLSPGLAETDWTRAPAAQRTQLPPRHPDDRTRRPSRNSATPSSTPSATSTTLRDPPADPHSSHPIIRHAIHHARHRAPSRHRAWSPTRARCCTSLCAWGTIVCASAIRAGDRSGGRDDARQRPPPGDAWPHRHVARHERATQRCGPFGDDDARVSSTARAAAPTSRPQAGRRSATLPRGDQRSRPRDAALALSLHAANIFARSIALDGAAATAGPSAPTAVKSCGHIDMWLVDHLATRRCRGPRSAAHGPHRRPHDRRLPVRRCGPTDGRLLCGRRWGLPWGPRCGRWHGRWWGP